MSARSTRALVLAAACLLAGPLVRSSAAAVSVPGNYGTIQAAINAVLNGSLPDGTTIDVAPGTYPETLSVGNSNKSLTVRGVSERASRSSTPPAEARRRSTYFDSTGRLVFSGLTFRNGAPASAAGGGFVIQESSPTFVDCTFEDNTAYDGAGGALIASNATFVGCNIHRNNARHFGGGVLIVGGSRPVFTRCDIADNHSGTGGGGGGSNGAGGAVFSIRRLADVSRLAHQLQHVEFRRGRDFPHGAVRLGVRRGQAHGRGLRAHR